MSFMKPLTLKFTFLLLLLLTTWVNGFSVVKYDEGRRMINGIQLLQDNEDGLAYYYLPQFPRISIDEDGTYELLCMKYIGQGGSETNGGLFHALVEFSLPDSLLAVLTDALQDEVPGARIVGPVPLQQALEDGETGVASFSVISAILNNTEGENPFTSQVVTSGFAPLLPGSKAAIAAKLSQEGATLLWESLQGPTSDVSVAIRGYYEAAVKGYNATVKAEVSTIYNHMSRIMNFQEGYSRRQLRKISDQLVQDQILEIDVFDRSEGLGIDNDNMEAILELVTDKLIELIFDAETGWSKMPETEVAVEQGQILGRRERGFFSKLFGGDQNEKYVSDNQYVVKKREDIKVNRFYLNLSKSTTVKVPVYTTGNLSGLYQSFNEDERYFRVVNLDDPDFQKREVFFQVDGQFTESFSDILNFVSVNFKKGYPGGQPEVSRDLMFNRKDLEEGNDVKSVLYPRLGATNQDWLDYEYRITWSLKGSNTTLHFPSKSRWASTKDAAISLIPPFNKRLIEVDADRSQFEPAGVHSASIRFFVILNGKAQPQRSLVLKSTDSESSNRISLYHDPEEPILYQVTWYTKDGPREEKPVVLKDDFILLLP